MKKILEVKFGSHLYGTNTENSDLDLKGLYLPTGKEIILGNYKETIQISRPKAEGERNTKDDIDIEYFSVDRFIKDLAKGQTWALDFLFAPESNYTFATEFGKDLIIHLRQNMDRLLTKNLSAFVGYAKMQSAKYGIKGTRYDAIKRTMELLNTLPDRDRLLVYSDQIDNLVEESKSLISLEKTPLIEIVRLPGNCGDLQPYLHVCGRKIGLHATVKLAKECYGKILDQYGARAKVAFDEKGVDWKALSHAVRVNSEAIELLSTGKITFPLPNKDLILKIKTKQFTFEEVATFIEQGVADLAKVSEESNLRENADVEWIEQFIYEIYLNAVKNG